VETFRADLHVHTVLSPCAEIEMLPPLIVEEALEHRIRLIAITDHNAAANVESVQKAALNSGLIVLPGMELQTREEVHVLCLFDTLEQVGALSAFLAPFTPNIENNPEYFGIQLVVDELGEMVREEKQMLLTSINISIEAALVKVNDLGGLLIPAHVNRKGFGLIEALGFVPDDIKIEALEVSRHLDPAQAYKVLPQTRGYPIIQNGDAHRLEEFLGSTYFSIEEPTIAEIRLALLHQEGRHFEVIR
jgi:3',5'-nucleoside bisphosphate phosphatase